MMKAAKQAVQDPLNVCSISFKERQHITECLMRLSVTDTEAVNYLHATVEAHALFTCEWGFDLFGFVQNIFEVKALDVGGY